MRPGTLELGFFLLAFLGLQIWWLYSIIKNQEIIKPSNTKEGIHEIKKKLEELLLK